MDIVAVGEKGDGIARVDGYTVFVPGAHRGDRVLVQITRTLPKYAFSKITG